MALTFGTGPFAPHPVGSFDVDPPQRPLLFWEPFPKRLRVVVNGEAVADSRDCLAVHQTGQQMRVAVPSSAVRTDLLALGGEVEDRLGAGRRWNDADGAAVARSIDLPPQGAAALGGHVVFDLPQVDAWYLEDDLGYAHPRDPYHRFDVHRSSRHVVVRLGDSVIAESRNAAILFETSVPVRFYLPPDSVRVGRLERSGTVSQCPYKGDGQHWHVVADGRRVDDACWNLTTPLGDASMIPRWFSFYPEKVDVEVDGEAVR